MFIFLYDSFDSSSNIELKSIVSPIFSIKSLSNPSHFSKKIEQAKENLEAAGGSGIGVPGLGGTNIFNFGKIGKDDKKLVEENNKNLKKDNLKNNKVTKIEIEGEKIDLRKQKEITRSNNQSATTTPNIASVDTNNYKIKEFPEIAGFSDSVFS